MTKTGNKQLMQTIFFELSRGNDKPFLEAMSDDMTWNWMGTGQWSKSFKGKPAVLNELWAAVKTTLTPQFKVFADLIIAEGNHVVIEAGRILLLMARCITISIAGFAVLIMERSRN